MSRTCNAFVVFDGVQKLLRIRFGLLPTESMFGLQLLEPVIPLRIVLRKSFFSWFCIFLAVHAV